jgi:copper(I)-binding protein
MAMSGPASAHRYESGGISVIHPVGLPTLPGATVGVAYMRITNKGTEAVRLTGASTPDAERVEVHSMSMTGGVMRMRQVTEGVTVPAGGEVKFGAGGLHFMLIGLKHPLVEEQMISMTLHFAGKPEIKVDLYIESKPPAGHEH